MTHDRPQAQNTPDSRSSLLTGLSARELEIVKLVATGASNRQIARELSISPNTVKVHLRNVFAKLEVASRTEAAFRAAQIGLIAGATPSPAKDASSGERRDSDRAFRLSASPWPVAILTVALLGFGAWLVASNFAPGPRASDSTINTPTRESRWQYLPPMPTGRKNLALVTHENAIYAIGGVSESGITGVVERYDPNHNSWTALPSKPTAVSEVRAVVVAGEIYVPGGRIGPSQVTSVLEVYDPREQKWEQREPLPSALAAYSLAALEGRILVLGGYDGESYLSSVYEYDREQDSWRELAPLPSPRAFAGVAAAGGRFHIVGGYDGERALTTHESFAAAQGTDGELLWRDHSPLPEGRYGMGISSIADIIHVIGGIGGGEQQPLPIKYLVSTDSWQPLEPPPIGSTWTHMGLVPFQTRIFAVGGEVDGLLSREAVTFQAVYTVAIPLLP